MIDFSGYTREAIQKEMLDQVDPNIDTREGSMIQTAIGPVAWYLEGVYMILKQIQDNAYPATAVGDCLDKIVQTRGLTRKQATAAVRKGTFIQDDQRGRFPDFRDRRPDLRRRAGIRLCDAVQGYGNIRKQLFRESAPNYAGGKSYLRSSGRYHHGRNGRGDG